MTVHITQNNFTYVVSPSSLAILEVLPKVSFSDIRVVEVEEIFKLVFDDLSVRHRYKTFQAMPAYRLHISVARTYRSIGLHSRRGITFQTCLHLLTLHVAGETEL